MSLHAMRRSLVPSAAVKQGSTDSGSTAKKRGFGAPAKKLEARKGRANTPQAPPPDVVEAWADPARRSGITNQLSGFAQQAAAAPQPSPVQDEWADELPASDGLDNSELDDAFAAAAAHLLQATAPRPPRLQPVQKVDQPQTDRPAAVTADQAWSWGGEEAASAASSAPMPAAYDASLTQDVSTPGAPHQPELELEPGMAELAAQLDSLLRDMPPAAADAVRSRVMTAVSEDDTTANHARSHVHVDADSAPQAAGHEPGLSHLASLMQQLHSVKAAAAAAAQHDQQEAVPGHNEVVEPIVLPPHTASTSADSAMSHGSPVVHAQVVQPAAEGSADAPSVASAAVDVPSLEGVAAAFEFGPVPEDLAPSREAERLRQSQQAGATTTEQPVAAHDPAQDEDDLAPEVAAAEEADSTAPGSGAAPEALEQEVARLRQELQQARAQLEATSSELEGCNLKLMSAQRDLGAAAALSRSLGEVDQQLHATQYELGELQRQHEELKAELESSHTKQQDMAMDIELLRGSQQAVRARAAELEDALMDARAERTEAIKERDDLAAQLQALQAALQAQGEQGAQGAQSQVQEQGVQQVQAASSKEEVQQPAAPAADVMSDERAAKVASRASALMARLLACEALPVKERMSLGADVSAMLDVLLALE